MVQDAQTSSESLVKGRSIGAFRCLNCFERISPSIGAKTYKCPHCSFEWRIFWINEDVPRIRGPVWDVNRKLSEEAMKKKTKGGKK